MREILFRGQDAATGDWIKGYFVQLFDDKGNKTNRIYSGYAETDCEDYYPDFWEVDPETVGQFTGLTDKNGKKVFEGDIIRFTDENSEYEWVGRVEFGNPNAEYNWGFQLVYINGTKANTDILLWFDMEETGAYSEVIGNIHDNPELLKGGAVDG